MPKPKKTPKAQTPKLTPPPLALAVAATIDPDGDIREMIEAYQRMPALMQALNKNPPSDARYNLITKLSGLDAAEHRAETGNPTDARGEDGDRYAYAIKCLQEIDVDLVADLTTPIIDGAFTVGLAFACYILLERGR